MAPTRFSSGPSLWSLSRYLRWDTRLAYTVVYPIPSVCQHAQPSTPNAEGNPRNQPEISVRRSTAKSADRYITHWRQQRDLGLSPHRRGPKPKHDPLAEEVRKLKQQNGQLTQRLARAELIIDVQKKVSLLLGIPLAAADNDGRCL